MWNEPTLEELATFEMPSTQKVLSTAYRHRKVYLHFFSDEEDYFVGGYDSDARHVVCYETFLDGKGRYVGGWELRRLYDELLTRKSSTGAELTRNINFVPCRASSITKIQVCDKRSKE